MKTLNYPQTFRPLNVNIIISIDLWELYNNNNINSKPLLTTPITEKIERFIGENPQFTNLLPLNQTIRSRNVDLQIRWTANYKLTVTIVNFKACMIKNPYKDVEHPDEPEYIEADLEQWLESTFGKTLHGEGPVVIWETSKKWRNGFGFYWDYETSPWPQGDYVEDFNPCNSCGISIGEQTDNATSCCECGSSIHGDGNCGPWLDSGQDGGSGNYETATCVQCYENLTDENYSRNNRFTLDFEGTKDDPNKGITYEDIRQTLTFIEDTFNSFKW